MSAEDIKRGGVVRRSSSKPPGLNLLLISKLNKALNQAILEFNNELVEYSNEFDTEDELIEAANYLLEQMTGSFKEQIEIKEEKVINDFVNKFKTKANNIIEQFISKMRERALFKLSETAPNNDPAQDGTNETDSAIQTESDLSTTSEITRPVSSFEKNKLSKDETISTLSSDQGMCEFNLGEEYQNYIKLYRSRLKRSIEYPIDEESIIENHLDQRQQMIKQFQINEPNADVQVFGQYLDQCFDEFKVKLFNKQTKLRNCFEESVKVYKQGMNELFNECPFYSEFKLKERHIKIKEQSINCFKQNIEKNCLQNTSDSDDLEDDLIRRIDEDFQKYSLKNESTRCKFEIDLESKIKLLIEEYEQEVFTKLDLFESKAELILIDQTIKIIIISKFKVELQINDEGIIYTYLAKLSTALDKSYERADQLLDLKLQKKNHEKQNLIKNIRDSYKQKMEEKFKIKRFYFKNKFLDNHYNIITLLAAQHKVDQQFLYNIVEDIFSEFGELNARNTPKVPAIGIDLGTHHSCVAYFTPDHMSTVLLNDMGKDVTPSVVSFRKNNEVVVGQVAKEESIIYKNSTIHSVKRLIGQTFADLNRNQNNKQFIENLDYNLINIKNQPTISVDIAPGVSQQYIPQEVSAKVLQQLKWVAQKYLEGFDVKKVVITVPAYFNESQKEATKEAGRMAGLEVLALLTEPTAAAIVFKTERNKDLKEKTILIFDFGGGTLDVAIVRLEKGEIITKVIKGDNYLGGNDIDNNLIEYCLSEFQKETGIKCNKQNVLVDRLRQMCEQAKIRLTSAESTNIHLNNFHQDKDLNVLLTQKTLNEINKELFERAISLVKDALKDAKLKEKDIDDIVLVGGSTRIPRIQQMLSKLFSNRPLNHTINPDHSVAIGAAIHAATLNGQSAQEHLFQLTEVNPMSLGVEKSNKDMAVLIPRNTRLPTKMTKLFANESNQKSVEINVYEGEEKVASRNHLLGKFILDDLPQGHKSKVKIQVTFEIKSDGILNVTAKCDNVQGNLDIKEHRSRLTEEQLQELFNKVDLVNKQNLKLDIRKMYSDEMDKHIKNAPYLLSQKLEECNESVIKLLIDRHNIEKGNMTDEKYMCFIRESVEDLFRIIKEKYMIRVESSHPSRPPPPLPETLEAHTKNNETFKWPQRQWSIDILCAPPMCGEEFEDIDRDEEKYNEWNEYSDEELDIFKLSNQIKNDMSLSSMIETLECISLTVEKNYTHPKKIKQTSTPTPRKFKLNILPDESTNQSTSIQNYDDLQTFIHTENVLSNMEKFTNFNYLFDKMQSKVKYFYQISEQDESLNKSEFYVMNDNRVYCKGFNLSGILGLGHKRYVKDYTLIEELCDENIEEFVGRKNYMFARNNKNDIFSWGDNINGQLARGYDNDDNECFKPKMIEFFKNKNIIEISCGLNHCLALTEEGTIYGWGLNDWGQTGCRIDNFQVYKPIRILFSQFLDNKTKFIQCCGSTSCAVTIDGRAYLWGNINGRKTIIPEQIDININKVFLISHSKFSILNNDGIFKIYKIFEPNSSIKIDKVSDVFGSKTIFKDEIIYEVKEDNKCIVKTNYSNFFEYFLHEKRKIIHTLYITNDGYIMRPTIKVNESSNKKPLEKLYVNIFDRKLELDFKIIKKIVEGKFGQVFEVKSKSILAPFAIKRIPIKGDIIKTMQEIRIMSQLSSEYVVKIYNSWTEGKIIDKELNTFLYIQMELCSLNLRTLIELINDLCDEKFQNIKYFIRTELFLEIIECLNHLHSSNPSIIHRDLKPQNILINKGENKRFVKITEFGSSIIQENKENTRAVGTREYMAPEVYDEDDFTTPGTSFYDNKSDIYSLGVIATKLFKLNYSIKSIRQLKLMDKYLENYSNSNLKERFSNVLKEISKMLSKTPEERLSSKELLAKTHEWTINSDFISCDANYQDFIEFTENSEKYEILKQIVQSRFDIKKQSLGHLNIGEDSVSSEFCRESNTIILTNIFRKTYSNEKLLDSFSEYMLDGKLENNFDIVKTIARGGFGVVFQVKDEFTNSFAIKRIQINGDITDVLKEIRIMTELKSEYVVKYHDSWAEQKHLDTTFETFVYIQMELCSQNLKSFIEIINELEEENYKSIKYIIRSHILVKIIECLNYLHSKDIIHRDLKLQNILLTIGSDRNFLKLCDFGLSKFIEILNTPAIGTNSYMAPEINDDDYLDDETGKHVYTLKADIYSLGVISTKLFGFDNKDSIKSIRQRQVLNKYLDRYSNVILKEKFRNVFVEISIMLSKRPEERLSCSDLLNKTHEWTFDQIMSESHNTTKFKLISDEYFTLIEEFAKDSEKFNILKKFLESIPILNFTQK